MTQARLRLGQLLVDARIISPEQLEQVLALQKADGRRLGTLLVETGLITETQLTQILSQQLSVPWVSLYHIDFSRDLLSLVPRDTAEKYCLVPIYVRPVRGLGDTLYVAMDEPMNEEALAACSESSGLPARAMIASPSDIRRAIRVYYGGVESIPPKPPATASGPPPGDGEETTKPDKAAPKSPLPPPQAAEAPRAEPLLAEPTPDAGTRPAAPERAGEAPMAEASEAPIAAAEAPPPEAEPLALAASRPITAGAGAPSADDAPQLEVREVRPKRKRVGMSLTFLDGTTIQMPSAKRAQKSAARTAEPASPGAEELTTHDVIAALRAACHGADPHDMLGDDARWEKLLAATLSLLLRKNLIFDQEFIDELKKI
jgi:type IV pilus assembly protein PilB